MWLVLEHLPVGRYLYAIGANPKAAALNGIPVQRFTVGGLRDLRDAGRLAGVLLASKLRIGQASVGLEYLLPALVGAFLGSTTIKPGRVNVWGTLVGVAVLAVGIAGIQQFGGSFWVEPLFNGVTLLVAIGIAGYAQRRKGAAARRRPRPARRSRRPAAGRPDRRAPSPRAAKKPTTQDNTRENTMLRHIMPASRGPAFWPPRGPASADAIADANKFVATFAGRANRWDGPVTGPKAAAGKTIVVLAADMKNGGVLGVSNGVTEAAKAIGWTVRVLDGAGSISGRTAAFGQAMALKPDGIIINGFDAVEQKAGIEEAGKAKIPLVSWHAAPVIGPVPGTAVRVNVSTDAMDVSRAAATWAFVDAGGKPGVIIFTDSTYAIAIAKANKISDVIKEAGGKVLEYVDTPIADTSTRMPQLTTSLLQSHGAKWTHSLAINDIYYDFMGPSLAAAGIKGDGAPINVAAGDGSESAYQRIRSEPVPGRDGGRAAEPAGLAARRRAQPRLRGRAMVRLHPAAARRHQGQCRVRRRPEERVRSGKRLPRRLSENLGQVGVYLRADPAALIGPRGRRVSATFAGARLAAPAMMLAGVGRFVQEMAANEACRGATRSSGMKRIMDFIWPLVGLVAVVWSVELLYKKLKAEAAVDPAVGALLEQGGVWDNIRTIAGVIAAKIVAIPPHAYLLCGLSTLVAYAALAWYDRIALIHLKRQKGISWFYIATCSFVTYALSHNIGASVFSGGMVRYRAYTAKGLSAAEVAVLVALCSFTFAFGTILLLGLVLVGEPQILRPLASLSPWFAVNETAARLVGFGHAGFLPALHVGSWLHFKPIEFGKFEIVYPRLPIVARQYPAAPLELIGAAGIIYFALPEGSPSFFIVLGRLPDVVLGRPAVSGAGRRGRHGGRVPGHHAYRAGPGGFRRAAGLAALLSHPAARLRASGGAAVRALPAGPGGRAAGAQASRLRAVGGPPPQMLPTVFSRARGWISACEITGVSRRKRSMMPRTKGRAWPT